MKFFKVIGVDSFMKLDELFFKTNNQHNKIMGKLLWGDYIDLIDLFYEIPDQI